MRKYAILCSTLLAATLLPAASFAQTRDIGVHGEMLDRIAAIVNDGLVLKSELDAQMDAVTGNPHNSLHNEQSGLFRRQEYYDVVAVDVAIG